MAQIAGLSKSAKLPITSVAFLNYSQHVLAGSGTCLLAIHLSTKVETVWNVLSKNPIHLILPGSASTVFIAGGREIVYGKVNPTEGTFEALSKRNLHDWILAAAYLGKTHIILATASNTILVLFLPDLETTQTVFCHERPFLWSASSTQTHYETLESVRLAVGTIMQNVLIWSPFVSTSVQTLSGHDGSIFGVAFSPSGNTVASVSDDRTVRVWDLLSGEVQVLWGHQDRVWRVVWVDEETIASAGQDAVVLLWKKKLGKWAVSQKWAGHDGKHVWALAVQDGKVLSGGADASVRLWDSRDNPLAILASNVLTSDSSADGHTIVYVTKDRQLFHVDNTSGTTQTKILCHLADVRSGLVLHLDQPNQLVWVIDKNGRVACYAIDGQRDTCECSIGQIISQSKLQVLSDGSKVLLAYDAKLKSISCFTLMPFAKPALLFSEPVPFARPLSFFQLSPTGRLLFLGDGWGKIAIYRFENNILTSLVSTKIHQDGFTDILVLQEAEDQCIFETVSRDGRWCRHTLAAGSIGEWSLNTTMTVSVGYDRLEKIAIVGSKRYLVAQSSGRFTLYDTFGDKLSSYPCSEPPPPHWRVTLSDGHCQLIQLSKGTLSIARWLVSNVVRPSFHGREIRCVSSIKYNQSLSLMASTPENSTLRISQISPDGNLIPLAVETGLRDNAKALNWIRTDRALYLLVTGVRELVHCYQVTIIQPGYLEDLTLELDMIAEDRSTSSLIDVRIVDSDAYWSEVSPMSLHLASGYSEGTLAIRVLDLQSKSWRTVSSNIDTEHPRCILSVKYFVVTHNGRQKHIVATGSTNGLIALWAVDSYLVTSESDQAATLDQPLLTLTGHQSGVNCLDVQSDSSHITIASGGDDNNLSISKLSIASLLSSKPGNSTLVETSVPRAHASAIQGVRFLDSNTVVTASWDQRCTLWRITEDGPEKLASQMSQIADCSSMDVLHLKEREVLVTMAGTGSECLKVNW